MSDAPSSEWSGRRVLVTGGAGYLGSHLVRRLVREGADVHVFLRPQTSTWRLTDCLPHITCCPMDVRDAEAVRRTVREIRPSVVFNVAAYGVAPRDTDRPLMESVNVLGTLHLLRACVAHGAPRVIHAGSCFEYLVRGPRGGSDELAYAASKLAATGVCQVYQRDGELPCVVLRPFTFYGPYEDEARLVPSVMRALLRGEAPEVSRGEQQRDFLFVDDVVEAFIRAATSSAAIGATIDIGSGQTVTVRAMVEQICAIAERAVAPRYGAVAQRPTDVATLVADPVAAQQLLDWRATTSLAEGLRRTWDWHRTRGVETSRQTTSPTPAPTPPTDPRQLKEAVFSAVRAYYDAVHRPKRFVPFESKISYAGRVFDAREMVMLADSALDFWLTLGPYGGQLEQRLKTFFGAKDAILVNSGSSANLLAVATLMSPTLKRPLQPGDEVITPAVTFPTSLAPLVQAGLVPVFVDCELGTYNLNLDQVEAALTPATKAVLVPHTLGNMCDLARLRDFVQRHRLWLIEDCCDALGGTFDGQLLGTFGDVATLSFYPAHHMTMGEGGAVIVNRPELAKLARSIRDWGRDCWCEPGVSDTCGKRFDWQLGDLPRGYDHKYIYSHVGYNLKPTDLQAAIGLVQFDKVPEFIAARRANFARLTAALQPYEELLLLPKVHPSANPAWFGLPLAVRQSGERSELIAWLEAARIETRQIFAGNILRQPAYRAIRHRVVGTLEESDRIMRDAFFVGVYPGLSDEMLTFMIERFQAFFERAVSTRALPLAQS